MSEGLSAGLYPITMYVTTIAIIINVFLIYSGKTIFYTGGGDAASGSPSTGKKMEVRLSKTIFYIYLIIIFIFALGQYVYSDKSTQIIQMARTKSKVTLTFQLLISIFNVIGILFLSYHIYFEIRNLNDTECPYPNEMICHAPVSSECALSNQTCPGINTDYKFKTCYSKPDKVVTKFSNTQDSNKYNLLPVTKGLGYTPSCTTDLTNFFANNFVVVSEKPVALPGDADKDADKDADPPLLCKNSQYNSNASCVNGSNASLTIYNASASPCSGSCTQEQCCQEDEDIGDLDQDDPRYSWIAKEDKLETVEGEVQQILKRISNLTPGGGISGPPGPPGPPGTPGSDGSTPPPVNLQSNIVCSKDGVCPSGSTKCNDKGQCVENFALISLEEKINLQNKYKDLNHNSYKADKLMNNLEQYLLNTFK